LPVEITFVEREMKKIILAAVLLFCPALHSQQSTLAPNWDAWKFIQGKWVGEGTSDQGQGGGYFTFDLDLQGKVLVRRNRAEYPATKDRPTYIHEDLMIVFFDPATKQARAFYTDNEGHVINYAVTFSADGNKITFLSDVQAAAPRYRLTYIRTEPERMTLTLEMAQPGKPDDFQKIVEGAVRKSAER
jgi:hypothetical protein